MKFKNFFTTTENSFAKLATEHFASMQNSDFQVMTITGPSGTGKSHLLHAAGWAFLNLGQGYKVKAISGDDLITDFQLAIQKRTMNEFRLKYRLETDILLIDDIHCLERAKATQTELFNLINEYQAAGKKIILTCDRPIQTLDGFDDRLKSRLLGGLHIPLEYPTLIGKRQILCYKLTNDGFTVGEAIVDRMLLSCGPCVRSVEGAIFRLKMLSQTAGSLTEDILEKMFPIADVKALQALTVDGIMARTCENHKITLAELRGPSRKRHLVSARRECATALRDELGKTTADISRALQRDHSTVISLLKTLKL